MVSGGFYSTNNNAGQSSPLDLTALGGLLYFVADRGDGLELWQSDGTADGTHEVAGDLSPANNAGPRHLAVAGATLFFAMDDGTHGTELWSYTP